MSIQGQLNAETLEYFPKLKAEMAVAQFVDRGQIISYLVRTVLLFDVPLNMLTAQQVLKYDLRFIEACIERGWLKKRGTKQC